MPFIIPFFYALKGAKTMQYLPSQKRVKYLKNIFYSRIIAYSGIFSYSVLLVS